MENFVKLANDVMMPAIGFGSGAIYDWKPKNTLPYYISNMTSKDKRGINKSIWQLKKGVNSIMKHKPVMLDTSRAYGGAEVVLGNALKKYKREDYFLVTKLSNVGQFNGDIRGAFESSLRQLQMDYVDLYLFHWPVTDIYIESYKQMEKLYEEGLCRAIGVCNCNIHHLERLKKEVDIMPMVNQFECHPLFTQNELRAYCKENDIQVLAYTATAKNDYRLPNTIISEYANKYNKTVPQIVLRWHLQVGNVPLVHTFNPKHIDENMNIYDFELTDEEVNRITALNINSRLRFDPDNCDFTRL